MPKYYLTEKVATLVADEVVNPAVISTEVERKRVLACYPDDSLTTSEFVAYLEREEVCRFYLDNLVGEASKRIEVNLEVPVGQTFYVGYKNPTGVSGDKFVVVEYEPI